MSDKKTKKDLQDLFTPNKDNAGWDDLKKVKQEAQLVFVTAGRVGHLLKDPAMNEALIKAGRYDETVAKSAKLLKELATAKAELNAIGEKHEGKSGDSVDPDELIGCIAIGQEYYHWIATYAELINPMVNDILNAFNFDDDKDVTESLKSNEVSETN